MDIGSRSAAALLAARARALLAAAALLAACAGPVSVDSAAPCPPPGTRVADGSPPPAGAGDAARGAALFRSACDGCHAADPLWRAADAPPGAPRLDCVEWLAAASDAYLYEAINRGPGRYGHAGRPPLGEQLRPADVADLVAYLRSLEDL